MLKTPWVPLLTAIVFQALAFTMTLALPETLPVGPCEQEPYQSRNIRTAAGISDPDQESNLVNKFDDNEKWKTWIRQIKDSFAFVARDAAVAALLLTFFVSKVGRQSINLLLQYVSKRFQWTLSKASYTTEFLKPLCLTPFDI
jgi:hypothetical protein